MFVRVREACDGERPWAFMVIEVSEISMNCPARGCDVRINKNTLACSYHWGLPAGQLKRELLEAGASRKLSMQEGILSEEDYAYAISRLRKFVGFVMDNKMFMVYPRRTKDQDDEMISAFKALGRRM